MTRDHHALARVLAQMTSLTDDNQREATCRMFELLLANDPGEPEDEDAMPFLFLPANGEPADDWSAMVRQRVALFEKLKLILGKQRDSDRADDA